MEGTRTKKIGEALIEVLNLKVKKNGLVNTAWGEKSPEGIARVVARILSWKEYPETDATFLSIDAQ